MFKIHKSFLLLALFISSSQFSYAEEQSTTLGSVLGATTGSVIGYQFGGGRGKYVTTAIGAVSGYIIGGKIQESMQQAKEPVYQPEYSTNHQTHYIRHYQNNVIEEDDYLIKQHLSDQRKRRNMIRNGEADPMEMPYDISERQTSWDDPDN